MFSFHGFPRVLFSYFALSQPLPQLNAESPACRIFSFFLRRLRFLRGFCGFCGGEVGRNGWNAAERNAGRAGWLGRFFGAGWQSAA